MVKTRLIGLLIMTIGIGGLALLPAGAGAVDWVYWNDYIEMPGGEEEGVIQRAPVDGSSPVEDLVDGLSYNSGLELDPAGGKMYWGDYDNGRIQRVNIDGGGPVEDFITGLGEVSDVALDTVSGLIYWFDAGTPGGATISRTDLSGIGPVETIVDGLSWGGGLALDIAGAMLYWSDDGGIHRTASDGTGEVDDLATGGIYAGVGIDIPGNTLYWSEEGYIFKSSLDGTAPIEEVAEVVEPREIEVDSEGGFVYWRMVDTGEAGASKIQRLPLDGTGEVEDIVTGLSDVIGTALLEGTAEFTLELELMFGAEILDIGFLIGTPEPATWANYLVVTYPDIAVIPLWTVPLPVIDPPVEFSFSIGLPPIGYVGFFSGLYTAAGAEVTRFGWVYTGP